MPAKPSFSKTFYPLCTFSSAPSTHFAVSVSIVPPPRYEYGANSAETPNSSTKYSAAIECWEHHRQFRSLITHASRHRRLSLALDVR